MKFKFARRMVGEKEGRDDVGPVGSNQRIGLIRLHGTADVEGVNYHSSNFINCLSSAGCATNPNPAPCKEFIHLEQVAFFCRPGTSLPLCA